MLKRLDVYENEFRPLLKILRERREDPEVLKQALALFTHQLKNYADWWQNSSGQDDNQRLWAFYVKTRDELIARTLKFLESYERKGLIHVNVEQIPEMIHEVKYWDKPDDTTCLLVALKNATQTMQDELDYELQKLNSHNWHLLDTVFGKPAMDKMTLGYGVNPLKAAGRYLLKDTQGMNNGNVVSELWRLLKAHRRNEHYYKEVLLTNFIAHDIERTSALAEVPVLGEPGKRSWFDLAVFGDNSTVFEIKSEFDSPERLKLQLPNYRSVFTNVMVVSSLRNSRRMLKHLDMIDPLAGLLVIGIDGELELVKRPVSDESRLRKESIIRLLHKTELERILISKFGLISEASREIYFRMLREMANEIDVVELQSMAMDQIRYRGMAGNEAFMKAPTGLKSTAYFMHLEKRRLRNFLKFLSDPFDQ